jgi:hypothetical protein
MDFLLAELPDLNWDSRVEVKDYLHSEHKFFVESIKLSELISLTHIVNEETELKNVLTLFVEYLKLKYLKRNYIDCILRHEVDGRVYLRMINGQYMMPNKRPYPYSTHIIDCIISQGTDEKE